MGIIPSRVVDPHRSGDTGIDIIQFIPPEAADKGTDDRRAADRHHNECGNLDGEALVLRIEVVEEYEEHAPRDGSGNALQEYQDVCLDLEKIPVQFPVDASGICLAAFNQVAKAFLGLPAHRLPDGQPEQNDEKEIWNGDDDEGQPPAMCPPMKPASSCPAASPFPGPGPARRPPRPCSAPRNNRRSWNR